MARPIYVPQAGRFVNFSDTASDEDIKSYIRTNFPKPEAVAPPVAPAPAEEAGIGALESGFYGALSRAEAASGKAAQGFGIDWLAKDLFDRARANEEYAAKYVPDVGNISDITGVGDVAKFAGSTIAQSAPETAVGVGGAFLGAQIGGAIGGAIGGGAGLLGGPAAPGTVPAGAAAGVAAGEIIGGIIGGAIASLPSFVGGNIQRQAQEQGIPLEETSGYSATVGAVAQAPLDAAFDTLIARKFPGAGAALDVVKKGFLKEVASTAAKGAVTEALTEPAQQAIEIAQSNPDKLLEFGPDVQNEILNAAAGGALAGGVIGGVAEPVAGVAQGVVRGKQEAAKKQLQADIITEAQRGERMKKAAEVNAGIESLAAQPVIGQLKLGKVQIDPTPDNGLKSPITRFQILDAQNKSIAEFSDPVNATDAVNTYSRVSGKKINLVGIDNGKITQIQTVSPTRPDPSAYPKVEPVLEPGQIATAPKPAKISKKMQEMVKKANIATRLQPIAAAEIPYDSLTWDDVKKAPISISGKSKVVDYGGRKIVVADVNGVKVPFYLSSGFGGKTNVPSGKWYPFFGIGSDGWINKTSQEDIANYYGDEDLKRVSQTLDATVGDIRGNNTIPRVGDSGSHIGFINSGLDPAENQTPETLNKVTKNINSILEKIRANRPAPEPTEVATQETPVPPEAITQPEAIGVAAKEAPAEEQAAVAEIPPPPVPTNPEIEAIAAPPIVDQAQQEAIRKSIAERKQKISEGVQQALKRYNLKDVETKFIPALLDKMGKVMPAEGSEVLAGDKSIVTLATNVYDPSLTVEQMVNKVVDALNHESIHSLFDLGLIRPSERNILLRAVETAKVPGKKYTYLDYARSVYDPSRPGLEQYADPELVREEAVAEMFRDWRNRGEGATQNTRGLFNRVIEALRHIFNVMRRSNYEDIFKDIESGNVGLRERAIAEGSETKFSVAPPIDSNEFRNWISGAKLVDENGNPLKLYTGTSKDTIFESFKDSDRGTWVTTDPAQASSYAMENDSMGLKRGPGWTYTKTNVASRVIPLYSNVKNILDLSTREKQDEYMAANNIRRFDGANGYQKEQAAIGRYAMYQGYDAIQWGPNVWAIFNPKKTLKSQFNPFTEKSVTSPKFALAPEMPKLSTAPVYPYGQQVPQVNAAQINNTLDHITYGAAVNTLDRVFNSKTASAIIPDRFRPSKEAYTDFIQKFADRMLPVGQMIDFIRQNGGTVPDALDAYMAEELMHSKVGDSLEWREDEVYVPLMHYIRDSGLNQQKFEDYLYARHAKERNDRIRKINPNSDPEVGSGMSDEEANNILRDVANSPNYDQYLTAESMFRRIIDDTNSLRVEGGLTVEFDNLTDEDGNPVQIDQYEFYAPLRGFADETITEGEIEDSLRARVGQGFKIRGREDMRAMGRTSKATNIIAHAILQNSEAVIRAAKNRVGQSFLGLVEANPELAAQYGIEVMTKGKKPLKRYISSKGVVKTMIDPMYKNSDDVMVVKRNGEEIPIKIDNRFLQKALLAKRSANPDIAERALGFLQKANRILAAVNTAYNPEFMLVNFPRDLQTALVNITQYEIDGIRRKVLKDALPAAKGVYKMLRNPNEVNEWTDWYNMFKADGGKTTGFFGTFSLEERIKKLEKISQDVSGQPTQRLKEAFEGVKGWLEDTNGALENAVRLSVYKNLVEAGLSRERAAQAAKNLTVNFDKRGEYGPFLNSLYLFYNASVQGTLSMMMAASRSKKVRRTIGGIAVVGLMQDMINSLMSDDDDDGKKIYDKIPDYKLETNMILMDPFGITKNGYYAIPLPYGFNAFYNMGRSIGRNLRGEYKTSQAVTSIGSTFIDAFNPIGGTESFLNFISPTVLDPVVALSINKDFTGRKIYPEPFPGSVPKADSQMYWSTTSPIFKNTAQFLNWATGGTEYVPGMIDLSPDVMEYMFDYMTGGVGAFARRIVDTATSTVPAALSGDLQEIEMNNVPIFRKLYGNVSTRVSLEDYFDKVNHVLARGEEYRSAMSEGNPERIKSVRARFGDEISIYPIVKSLANRRNKLAGDLRKLRNNPKIPPEQKRRRQELLQNQIEQITNRVNKLYEEKIGNKYPSLFS